MATREDILSLITQNKNSFPYEIERKKRIEEALSNLDKNAYSDKPNTNILKLFSKRFEEANGKIFFVNSLEEIIKTLKNIANKNNVTQFFTYNKEINNALDKFNWTNNIINANATITFCDYLIARTGTIMVSTFSVKGRKVISYPDISIIIAEKSQLVFGLNEAINKFLTKHKTFPSFVSFITGVSKTADIEKTLILGAHGPKKIFLLLSNKKII